MEATTQGLTDVRVINFAEAIQPVFTVHRTGAHMKFGEDNLYPDYLQSLYDNATKHGALIDGKVTYIAGKGWQVKEGQDPNAEAFIKKVNRYGESLADVNKKVAKDKEIFGGAYMQIIWSNVGGRIAEIYHIDYTRMRSNEDNTQFYFRKDWAMYSRSAEKIYPAFNPANPRGSQILFDKEYRPGMSTYPLPGYMRALNYISAEIEVGKHTYGNAQSGFTPSKAITLTNGEPTDDEKKKVTKRFEKAFTGADGKKFILWFVNNAEKKPIIEDLGQSDLTKEDFTAVDNLIQSNIYAGHQITTPALFGISTPGSLGQSKEIRDGYEVFRNTYVNDKQQALETTFNMLARHAGIAAELAIVPTEPVGFDIKEVKDVVPYSYLLNYLGIDPVKYPDAPIINKSGLDSPQQPGQMEGQSNSALLNLSGKQNQQLHRILRAYDRGKITAERAKALMRTSYGLSDEDIDAFLALEDAPGAPQPTAFSEDDTLYEMFAACGEERSLYESLRMRKVSRDEDADDVSEFSHMAFVAAQAGSVEASILDLISKDKRITPEAIADVLKVEPAKVQEVLQKLVRTGAVKVKGPDGEEIRTLTRPLAELQDGVKAETKEYVVRYSYEGPQDSKNRPFCAKMMQLGRFYSRTEIESISQRLGYSVWDRRGGFYTHPGTDNTTPYCRHSWFSHVVKKK